MLLEHRATSGGRDPAASVPVGEDQVPTLQAVSCLCGYGEPFPRFFDGRDLLVANRRTSRANLFPAELLKFGSVSAHDTQIIVQ